MHVGNHQVGVGVEVLLVAADASHSYKLSVWNRFLLVKGIGTIYSEDI